MSFSTSSMLDPSDADRKLAESPTPFLQGQWDYETIPKKHNNRTVVLCFDGTGDKFDADVRKPPINIMLSYHHHPHSIGQRPDRSIWGPLPHNVVTVYRHKSEIDPLFSPSFPIRCNGLCCGNSS